MPKYSEVILLKLTRLWMVFKQYSKIYFWAW